MFFFSGFQNAITSARNSILFTSKNVPGSCYSPLFKYNKKQQKSGNEQTDKSQFVFFQKPPATIDIFS